jgi:hypothetical protein
MPKPLPDSPPKDEDDNKLSFAPWIDDPDPPDYMTDAEIERMAKGFHKLKQDQRVR